MCTYPAPERPKKPKKPEKYLYTPQISDELVYTFTQKLSYSPPEIFRWPGHILSRVLIASYWVTIKFTLQNFTFFSHQLQIYRAKFMTSFFLVTSRVVHPFWGNDAFLPRFRFPSISENFSDSVQNFHIFPEKYLFLTYCRSVCQHIQILQLQILQL